jgi:predicted ATP-grasp superfamily ATP-dependent carboligase
MPVEPQLRYREGVIWVDWQRDVRAAFAYWQKGQLSVGRWLRSLQGEKMWAVYSADDWRPGVAFTIGLVSKLLGESLRSLRREKSRTKTSSNDGQPDAVFVIKLLLKILFERVTSRFS